MRSKAVLLLAFAITLALSGCVGDPGASSTTPPGTTQSTPPHSTSPTPPSSGTALAVEEAKRVARDAERERVQLVLSNATNVSGSVGVYGTVEATVVDRNVSSVSVRVAMPYSYEYSCDNRSGAVDGLTTHVTYRVTAAETTLIDITEDVRFVCE